jgi:HK97 family phage prohead protease
MKLKLQKDQIIEIGKKVRMLAPIKVKAIDKENYTLTMVSSTQDTDRHGDIIMQKGWDLEAFNANPVILNSHQYGDATEVIANASRTEIKGRGDKARLEQDWKFAVNENPKAKVIFDLYAGGFLHASSVGLIPRKFAQDKDGNNDWSIIEEAELLEVSAVSVPANARALAKAKGIDVDIIPNKKNDIKKITKSKKIPPAIQQDAPEAEPDKPSKKAIAEKSYKTKVIEALSRIETKDSRRLQKVHKIIAELLNTGDNDRYMNKKIRAQVRNRKINQAIRGLIKIK